MQIDSHQHFWRFNTEEFDWITEEMKTLKRDFLPEDLFKELSATGFQGSVTVQARQTLEETAWLLKLADEHSFIKGVVGWVELCSQNVERQLSQFSTNKKFVGVRHIAQDEPDENFLLRHEFLNGVKYLQNFNLTYDILIYPKQLRTAIRFVEQFPGMRFVLDHIAKPFIKKKIISPWKEEITELSKFPNLFCKVSGMVTEADWKNWKPDDFIPYLDIVFGAFGADRIMLGSDWPVCTIAGSYRNVMGIMLEYIKTFSSEEQSAILGGNAVRAYNLK